VATSPLVSIICLCYKHEKYVKETLISVWEQTYPHIEVIIVDDGSYDRSVEVIRQFLKERTAPFPVKTMFLSQNVGNCKAFNQAWRSAGGKYVIDLAADDVMLPDRVEKQVAFFETLSLDYGVVFTESRYMDAQAKPLDYHFAERYRHIRPIPEGKVFCDVLSGYFISSPTMMIRNEVLARLDGYDESLAYEDFDFWVRSARDYRYAYLDECTTLVRVLGQSMSRQLYRKNDRQLFSTYRVCQKAAGMLRSSDEKRALLRRIRYEARHAVFAAKFSEASLFLELERSLKVRSFTAIFLKVLVLLRLDLSALHRWYLSKRYGKKTAGAKK
jgi:glycosyltransferase involved in cell wall biosynthesis